MEKIIPLLVLAALLLGLIRLMLLPMKWVWKLVVNGICGISCLWLVNLTAGLTGFSLPVNLITALLAGTLGLPGLLLLIVLQVCL